jgi:hypothetical protein
MLTKDKKKSTLRNEEFFTAPKNLPSGTFTRDGQPTIVTQIISLHLVNRMMNEPGAQPNSAELRSEIVDHLDSLGLLPMTPQLDKESKMTKISMALNFMLREHDTIQTKHLNIYTACKTAMRRSISQIKIAQSHS